MGRLVTIRIYTVCHFVIYFWLKPQFATTAVSKFWDGRVHVRNLGMQGLRVSKLFSIEKRKDVRVFNFYHSIVKFRRRQMWSYNRLWRFVQIVSTCFSQKIRFGLLCKMSPQTSIIVLTSQCKIYLQDPPKCTVKQGYVKVYIITFFFSFRILKVLNQLCNWFIISRNLFFFIKLSNFMTKWMVAQQRRSAWASNLIKVFAVLSICNVGPKLSSCEQRRLIWLGGCPGWSVFAGHTCQFVGFVMRCLNLSWYAYFPKSSSCTNANMDVEGTGIKINEQAHDKTYNNKLTLSIRAHQLLTILFLKFEQEPIY